MNMKDFAKKFWFDFLFAGATIALAANALKHESHPGAALWMLCFVLVVYLRELLRLTQERNEDYKKLAREQIDDNKKYSDFCKNATLDSDRRELAYRRDILHNVYNEEKGKWEADFYNLEKGKWELTSND